MNTRNPSRNAASVSASRKMAGVGMIEVLVAILILTFGMMGIAAVQVATLKNSQSALERSQAVVQTYAMLDAMRANRDEAIIGRYDMALTCDPPGAAGTLVANDIDHWISSMQEDQVLGPSACGGISCNDQECTVIVQWDDSRGTAGGNEQRIETTTRL